MTQLLNCPRPRTWCGSRTTLWQKHSIATKFYGRSDSPKDIYVVLRPMQALNEPDLLLYWSTNAPQGNVLAERVPSRSRIHRGRRPFVFRWMKKRAGNFVLFSLAHQTVFDSARVEKLP